jgi:hypothetical protein
VDRSRELFIRAIAGGAGPKGVRAALAGFALLVPGAAWYSTVAAGPYTGTPIPIGTHPPGSVIHDRVVRGASPLAASPGPLEGVLEPAHGVLTPAQ